MRLASARVRGFQSFNDSGDIVFSSGINLLIGQNNSGKSAFLRSLLQNLPDDRHRTPARWEDFRLPTPQVDLVIEVSGSELEEWILRSRGDQYIPIWPGSDPAASMRQILGEKVIRFSVTRAPNSHFGSQYPSHGLFSAEAGQGPSCAVATPRNGEISVNTNRNSAEDSVPQMLWDAWGRDMFYFAAERMTIGEASAGYAGRLFHNASNLPNVLHTLSSERGDVFARLVSHLREIFSTVGNLSVRTRPENSALEVRVWPTEAMERVELSFPLNSSGTGVSQVTALLAAIMTLDRAVFIIDEINSFLHPAAVKNLLRIIQTEYDHHQYLISTHAPEVIGFSNPRTLHLARRNGYESTIEPLDLENVAKLRELADHLGVSMSDVFAAERVIWVEGPTEELCFPVIFQDSYGILPRGTVITSVSATGDFNTRRRDPEIVYEVYERLTSATANLVVKVAFSFDSERLSASEKSRMQSESGGLLHFLPRRHLECYLLCPAAIAEFIVYKDPAAAERATPDNVRSAIETVAAERPFKIPEWKGDILDPEWLGRVDAAKLIYEVCARVSDSRAPFNKKDDALFLVRHILENNPSTLDSLRDYVRGLVEAVT